MIDISIEPLIRLTEAGRLAGPGRGNRPTHLSTLIRWIVDGVKTSQGERVRLEAVRVGGAWKTSAAAMQRFLTAITPQLDGQSGPPSRTPTAGKRAADRAMRKLEALGQ